MVRDREESARTEPGRSVGVQPPQVPFQSRNVLLRFLLALVNWTLRVALEVENCVGRAAA